MPICPECKEDIKSRKDGACPVCGTELVIHNGQYYREAPTKSIMTHFERCVSKQASAAQGIQINFAISRKTNGYKRECVEAERLLELCEGDLDLAVETLDVLFENRQFSFKTRTSMIGIQRDAVLAVVIARAVLTRRKETARKVQSAFEIVMSKEDIFS